VRKPLRREVVEWALEQIFHTERVKDSLSPYFWKLLGHGPLREKIDLMARLFFIRPENISGRYRTPVRSVGSYLFYGVRFAENARRYFRALCRIATRDEQMSAFRSRQQRGVAMMEWLSQKE
jgi:hypothetical protein